MIARICGKVTERGSNFLLIDISGLCYKVFIPLTVMQRLEENICADEKVSLITYHYFQVEPTKSTPMLIGFLNEVEKEFFEAFITVSGIGPRAALRALNKPIAQVVRAIEEADMAFLRSLPGIGEQRAKEIVAKLQNKVGKFGLIQDDRGIGAHAKTTGIEEEALAVLMQLEYKKPEAASMIKKALERGGEIRTTEELLNEVYRQKKAR
ncbi:MAG: Holliday junction ATP-dependent DNA helicase RuvA [Candidatus Omnitrophica bacterium]|nr:Holliday junction ATP-dependent DNA helicase RuvA [Candidatus Omnitrophota bacterium]MDD5553576.1 Holliday junction ATP-dependent DNA helicase RuvA [Candidatus Omnitrophota bacterium]